ncbi:hypothetical protein [Mycobacterium intracellulare]|uniref:hypothetical protein n=1 Tax=Mycobacterium intracellulare TaxID=1767 RepID=UPI001CD9A197|nr:hypothetical protein [Mycobacterium intracellulare]
MALTVDMQQVHLKLGMLRLGHDRAVGQEIGAGPAMVFAQSWIRASDARGVVPGDKPCVDRGELNGMNLPRAREFAKQVIRVAVVIGAV